MSQKAVEDETSAVRSPIDSANFPPVELSNGAAFTPFVPLDVTLRELTPLAVFFGVVLGVVLGASSLYLLLKVGLTISSPIVIAVTSITLFRVLSKLGLRNPSILEHNIAQSAGSAGEPMAFGIGLIVPAALILGFRLQFGYAVLVSLMGGVLGVLLMIPLRRQFIVRMHGQLKYPEGIACAKIAETLVDKGGRTILFGFAASFVYSVLMDIFKGWSNYANKIFSPPFRNGSISIELSPLLVGIGYIIGPRAASTMCAGGLMAFLVLIPLINYFGSGVAYPVSPESAHLIRDMGIYQLRNSYITFIGAGAIATSGLFSLLRTVPAIWQSVLSGYADLKASNTWRDRGVRTDWDIPIKWVLLGVSMILVFILIIPSIGFHLNIPATVLVVILGFIYVSVSARLTGELGSSSNPLTAFSVGSLLVTCLVFVVFRWTGTTYYITALSIGAIIGVAVSTGGVTSQVLKTGFLLGATPRLQQVGILVGVIISALVLGPVLVKLNDSSTVYVPSTTFTHISRSSDTQSTFSESSFPEFIERLRPPRSGKYRLFKNEPNGIYVMKDLNYGEYLVNETGNIEYKVERNFPSDLRPAPEGLEPYGKLKGLQGESDRNNYRLWKKSDDKDGLAGLYLVNDSGVVEYLVDPGINGVFDTRPDGSHVEKFAAPKATLVGYIIKATLQGEVPWVLVLLGVMISVVLELCQVSSLVFAVGLYLPLSSSMPIFFGGMIRKLIDTRRRRRTERDDNQSAREIEEQSPGVLMASGYIAGGTVAAILTALIAGGFTGFQSRLDQWASAHNAFFEGPNADVLSLIPFTIMIFLLYFVARPISLFRARK